MLSCHVYCHRGLPFLCATSLPATFNPCSSLKQLRAALRLSLRFILLQVYRGSYRTPYGSYEAS